jgi:hypothetical protein
MHPLVMATKDNQMEYTKHVYPQQDGTTLQGAIINYCDMLLPEEKAEAWELLLPLYVKPNMHLSDVTLFMVHDLQRNMWLAKAPSSKIDRLTFHWNQLVAIAKADHNIPLTTLTTRRPLFK